MGGRGGGNSFNDERAIWRDEKSQSQTVDSFRWATKHRKNEGKKNIYEHAAAIDFVGMLTPRDPVSTVPINL